MDHLHNAGIVGPSRSADAFREAARSENTRIAYEKGWRCFTAWCRSVDLAPQVAKPEDIVRFLVTMAKRGPRWRQQAARAEYNSALSHWPETTNGVGWDPHHQPPRI